MSGGHPSYVAKWKSKLKVYKDNMIPFCFTHTEKKTDRDTQTHRETHHHRHIYNTRKELGNYQYFNCDYLLMMGKLLFS